MIFILMVLFGMFCFWVFIEAELYKLILPTIYIGIVVAFFGFFLLYGRV